MQEDILNHGIPESNIKTYLHWYGLLKQIQGMPFEPEDFDKPLEILRELQRKYDLSEVWLWTAYKPINQKICEQTNLFNPFRQVQHFMIYGHISGRVAYKDLYPKSPETAGGSFTIRDYGKKREGSPVKSWGFNVLLSAVVHDAHWYGQGKKFKEAVDILEYDLEIEEANDYDSPLSYDNLRKHYNLIDQKDIMSLLEALYLGCLNKGIEFIPSNALIRDFPIDFLAYVAHDTGYKENPYLCGKQTLSQDHITNLPKHLKRLLNKAPRK